MDSARCPVMSSPPNVTRPADGVSRPVAQRNKVDLPAPFVPSRATDSPGPTCSDTPNSTCSWPYENSRSSTASNGPAPALGLVRSDGSVTELGTVHLPAVALALVVHRAPERTGPRLGRVVPQRRRTRVALLGPAERVQPGGDRRPREGLRLARAEPEHPELVAGSAHVADAPGRLLGTALGEGAIAFGCRAAQRRARRVQRAVLAVGDSERIVEVGAVG